MKSKNIHPFARKLRQFNYLVKQLKRQLANGQFHQQPPQKQNQVIEKLKRLYCQLKGQLGIRQMRKVAAGCSLIISMLFSQQGQAQIFGPEQTDVFGLSPSLDLNFLAFADVDNDGDYDAFNFGNTYGGGPTVQFFENTGTAESPAFGPEQTNPFNISPPENITSGTLADIDNDGDLDIFIGTYETPTVQFLENTGTATMPTFADPQINPFGINMGMAEYFSLPEFADLDLDGDLDFLSSEYYGVSQYFQNTGTAEEPAFSEPVTNAFGILPAVIQNYLTLHSFADLDNDGDLDILSGSTYDYGDEQAHFYFQKNIGNPAAPTFTEPTVDTLGLTAVADYLTQPSLVDIDNDGDLDLFSGTFTNYTVGVRFYENISEPPTSADQVIETFISTPYTFSTDDFTFNDPNSEPFSAIRVMTLNDFGTLQLNGSDVLLYDTIPVNEIPLLVYTPVPGEQGLPYDAFQFKVSNGTLHNAGNHTMTINVGGVGTKHPELNGQLKMFPNPVNEVLQLELISDEFSGEATISIFQTNGQLVHQSVVSVNGSEVRHSLSVAHLASGFYIVKIQAGEKNLAEHFVKK